MNSPYNGRFQVTQEFKGAEHDGLDLVGLDSKEVHSTVDGEVVFAGWENPNNHKQGFGQYVVVQSGKELYHYGHLSEIKVTYGQKVKTGDIIGVEGDTGYSFGSHCHYCVRKSMSPGTFLDVNTISGIPNQLGVYDDSATSAKEAPKATPTTEKKKVTDEIINAVKSGKYGNGAVRKNKLEKEGYSYEEVQAAVNKSLETKKESTIEAKHDPAMSFDNSLSGSYAVSPMGGLNVRKGAGITKELITTLPWNTTVNCYGYYTEVDGVKWYLIKTANTEGFVSSQYLTSR